MRNHKKPTYTLVNINQLNKTVILTSIIIVYFLNLFTGPAPIGYPRNVAAKPLDDGLLVTWEPPEFGMQLFKTYIVRYNTQFYSILVQLNISFSTLLYQIELYKTKKTKRQT